MKLSNLLPASLTAVAITVLPLAAIAQYKGDAPTTTTQESRPGAANPPGASPAATKSPAVTPSTSTARVSETALRDWERTHRATKIIGTDVRNLKGEKIGDVKDIVLDGRGGVSYAVVSTGGFLGMGDRLHAVPWDSLQIHESGKDFYVLDIDKARLALVPGFTSKSWPDFTNERWNAENRKYYPIR